MRFQVVEMTHGWDIEFTGVQLFATLEEAQAFALAHYETQISDGGEWWKSYEVQVWDHNDKQVTEEGK